MKNKNVEPKTGNIFDSHAQTFVNTVNCVGVMGKGIALEFKKRYPDMYKDYAKRCELKQVKLGEPYLYKRTVLPWILNFPTKDHWRSISRLEDIINGLEFLSRHYEEWGITSLAVPPLGTGHGQLDWNVVGPTLYRYLSKLNIPVELYAPYGTRHEELQISFLEQAPILNDWNKVKEHSKYMKPSWVAIVAILDQLEKEPYHWPIGSITFQKIAYFATKAGIPTGLEYSRGSFGPFAPKLKSIITRLANHKLVEEERLGNMLQKKVGPTYLDAKKVYKKELDEWEQKIEKIADLFSRMHTQQAEIAATVHFAYETLIKQNKAKPSEKDVLDEVINWKQRRRPPLDESEVASAIRNLSMLSWLDVTASTDLPLPEDELIEY